MASQIAHHGFDPNTELIELKQGYATEATEATEATQATEATLSRLLTRRSDGLWATTDILDAIRKNQSRLALVLLGGVHYLSGQRLEMAQIAARVAEMNAEAAKAGQPPILLGYDLAHAAGNVPLSLHDWGVDFAAWCPFNQPTYDLRTADLRRNLHLLGARTSISTLVPAASAVFSSTRATRRISLSILASPAGASQT